MHRQFLSSQVGEQATKIAEIDGQLSLAPDHKLPAFANRSIQAGGVARAIAVAYSKIRGRVVDQCLDL
jgi:hypothetical protein